MQEKAASLRKDHSLFERTDPVEWEWEWTLWSFLYSDQIYLSEYETYSLTQTSVITAQEFFAHRKKFHFRSMKITMCTTILRWLVATHECHAWMCLVKKFTTPECWSLMVVGTPPTNS